MMRCAYVAVAVLSLLAVGQSAPVSSCENLIKPRVITTNEQLQGMWIRVAESTDHEKIEAANKKYQESTWIKITANNASGPFDFMAASKMFGMCVAMTFKMATENGTLLPVINNTIQENPQSENKVNLLTSNCADCLVLQMEVSLLGKRIGRLVVLSKTGHMTDADLAEFKKQAECLHLREPFFQTPDGGLCPEPQSQETQEMRLFIDGEEADILVLAAKMIKSVGGEDKLAKILDLGQHT